MMIMHVNTTFMIIKILKNPKDFTPRKFFSTKEYEATIYEVNDVLIFASISASKLFLPQRHD